jgi:PPOX class probable F420-dependent enzyme
VELPDHVRAFLQAPRFASIATANREGEPRQSVVWYLLRGDTIVVNGRRGRSWAVNLLARPAVSLSIVDASDGYRWVGLHGQAMELGDGRSALADISEMARAYLEHEAAEAAIRGTFERQERISFRVEIEDAYDHLT